jgi:hypothetical protein
MTISPEQLNNLRLARDFTAQTPETDLDLDDFVHTKQGHCGTLFCAVGNLSRSEHFQKLGFSYQPKKAGPFDFYRFTCVDPKDAALTSDAYMDVVFGDGVYNHVFATYGNGYFDREILGEAAHEVIEDANYDGLDEFPKPITDKQLALRRFDMFIEKMEREQ